MPSYDTSRFNPPAPLVSVTLRSLQTDVSVSGVELLLDTGADITLVPRLALETLDSSALTGEQYELVGFDGSRSHAFVARLDMIFLGRTYRGRYLITEEPMGILGRDILNHAILLLDGPQQLWTEHTV